MPKTEPRILLWDVESTGLNATFGTLLCIGWKFLGEKKVYCPLITECGNEDMLDDSGLVARFAEVFETCDYHVTYYGKRFDYPLVQSKLLLYGQAPLSPKPHLDLWFTSRYKLKLHNNRLDTVAKFLQLENQKNAIDFEAWRRAAIGDKKALGIVKSHCIPDVLVLEEAFLRMRPLIADEPLRQNVLDGIDPSECVSCGSPNVTRRGFYHTKTRRYQRWQCQDCGKWMRDRSLDKSKKPPTLVSP